MATDAPDYDDLCDAEQWLVDCELALHWIVEDGDDGRAYKCTITWVHGVLWPREIGAVGRGDTRTQAVTRAVSAANPLLKTHPPQRP